MKRWIITETAEYEVEAETAEEAEEKFLENPADCPCTVLNRDVAEEEEGPAA